MAQRPERIAARIPSRLHPVPREDLPHDISTRKPKLRLGQRSSAPARRGVTEKEIEMAHHFKNMAELKDYVWPLAETARKETEQSYGWIATAAARGNQHAYEHVVNLLDDSFIGPEMRSEKPFGECR